MGTFLPVLPLIPQYLHIQGLHGAHRRELLREGGGEEREPLKPRPPSTQHPPPPTFFPKTLDLSQSCALPHPDLGPGLPLSTGLTGRRG